MKLYKLKSKFVYIFNLYFFLQRQELMKFQKLMRQRRPQSKFSLQYDKLIIDNEIYMFNDLTGKVEEVPKSEEKIVS